MDQEKLIKYAGDTNIHEIVIPLGVREIGENSFSECINLEIVDVPESVDWIDSNAFSECAELKKVIIRGMTTSIEDNAFPNNRIIMCGIEGSNAEEYAENNGIVFLR